MKERLDYLDYARGISVILVVIFHATIALGHYDLASPAYWLLNNFMSPIRMPVFFFISGLLARGALQSAGSGRLAKRVSGLVYLFLVWSTIHIAWSIISFGSNVPDIGQIASLIYSPSSVLWFIWALAIYFCVAWAGQTVSTSVTFAVSILLSLATFLKVIEFDNYVHNNVLKFMPIFLFGAWYSDRLMTSRVILRSTTAPALLAGFVVVFALIYEGYIAGSLKGMVSFAMMALGVCVGLSLSAFMCRHAVLSRLPIIIGRNTLSIYVAHSLVIGVLAYLMDKTLSGSGIVSLLGVPVISIIAIAASLGLRALVDKMGLRGIYRLPV